MKKLLESSIPRLREMRNSDEMTLADRDQLSSVIASLESLQRDLADEHGTAKNRDRIFQIIMEASKILAKIFLDQL